MGNRNHTGFSNSIPQPTSTGTSAKPSYILRRAKSLDTGGSKYPSREGSCNQHTQPSASGEFLLNSLPNTQERGSDETSDKPQAVERMGKAPALQDGGCRDTQRVTEGKRLDGEGGPQGCLLHSPNPCGSPTHASVSGGVGTLSVHMPAVWHVLCTLGIHQSNETSGHLPSEHGRLHGHLHRRHTPDGRVCGAGDTSSRSTALPIDRAGVHYQCAQVSDLPHSTDRVPGSPGTLYHTTFEPARGEAPPHQVGSEPDPAERSGDSTSTGSSNRETTCSIPSSSPSSLVSSFPSRRY